MGTCIDSKCDCLPGWDSFIDCQSEYCIKIEGKNLISCSNQVLKMLNNLIELSGYGFLIILISLVYVCFIDNDCNSHGICNDGTCNCESDWDVKSDCSGNIHYDTV